MIDPTAPPATDVHAALVRVSLVILPTALRMPEGSKIHGAYLDPHRPDLLYLRVTHPSLPAHQFGDRLAEVDLLMYEPAVEVQASEFVR